MELQAVQDRGRKIAVGVLEQWHEKQFVGRKRGCMDRDFGSFG